MSRMVEVVIDSVRVSLTNQQRIVVLREANVERYLPIWIGPYEAEAITIALQDVELARPQTHDLLKNLIQKFNGRLVRVEVLSLREDVYYGNLVIDVNGQMMDVDCRPSDAMALAVRMHAPILVAREVMDSAGIIPEEDMSEQSTSSSAPKSGPSGEKPKAEETADTRLEVFEDFFTNLGLDSLDEDDPDQPGQEPDNDEEPPKKKR